jgi:ABC-type polar amino acid transport system ATPase subunit
MLPMGFCNVYHMRLLEQVGIAEHAHKLLNALSGEEQQRATN